MLLERFAQQQIGCAHGKENEACFLERTRCQNAQSPFQKQDAGRKDFQGNEADSRRSPSKGTGLGYQRGTSSVSISGSHSISEARSRSVPSGCAYGSHAHVISVAFQNLLQPRDVGAISVTRHSAALSGAGVAPSNSGARRCGSPCCRTWRRQPGF